MKKLLFSLILLTGMTMSAQTLIGVSYGGSEAVLSGGGISIDTPDVNAASISIGGLSHSEEDVIGFDYGGALGYGWKDGNDAFSLGVGAGLRFYVVPEVFIRGGVGLSHSLESKTDGISQFGISAGPSLGIRLAESVDLVGSYSWQLNNALTDTPGASLKARGWSVGLQFKL